MTFPMSGVYRLCLWLVVAGGSVVVVMLAAEALGFVPRGAWIGRASDAERIVALVFASAITLGAVSVFPHARIRLDDEAIRYLKFGVPCSTARLEWARIRRFGRGYEYTRGRRRSMLLFELDDGTTRAIKLAMYARQDELVAALRERLGEPQPTEATMLGVRFADEGPVPSSGSRPKDPSH